MSQVPHSGTSQSAPLSHDQLRAQPIADDICVSALGVTSAIGQGKSAFLSALLKAEHAFGYMQRAGRALPSELMAEGEKGYIGAEVAQLIMPQSVPKKSLRNISLTGQMALATLDEAWQDAKLADVDPRRVGLIIGGSNIQQRSLLEMQQKYATKPKFIKPTHAMTFMDSDLCGLCTEHFGIRGFAYTLGSASASGQVAVIQAVNAVMSGQVDVCIAMGAMMDLSYLECQGFRTIGAMGSDKFANAPELAARTFDKDRNGFIFGEGCAAIVIERADHAQQRQITPYARVRGMGLGLDANRNPDPSLEGEKYVIQQALSQAGIAASQVDYVNPHGTGSNIGDEIEIQALQQCGLQHAYVNATKSITGHGLTAAGAVEIAATLLQMQAGQLHPCRNLDNPIADLNWVRAQAITHQSNIALSMSMGFGGISSAMCFEHWD